MAGIYVPWLVDAARLTGYPVVEIAGWRTRGHGGMAAVEGVLCHHTAGPAAGEYPSLRVVRDGRAGLAGPLSQLGIGRSGTVYVIAAGTAWHAGASTWDGLTGLNSRFLGIEAEDDGDGTWTAEQLDVYPRLAAALLHYMRRPAFRCAGHREVALPKGRKIDPAGLDMHAVRAQVGALLRDPLRLIPRSTPAPAPVPSTVDVAALQRAVRVTVDRVWGRRTDTALNRVRAAARRGELGDVRALQAVVGTTVDGKWGPRSAAALLATVRAVQAALQVVPDGEWGEKTDAAWAAARAEHGTGL